MNDDASIWHKLMSKKRVGEFKEEKDLKSRTSYQRDYDRIVFSAAFRRLQDKTQVFPLSDNDYARTRLTHSVETSSVGRSLGTIAGEAIISKYNLTNLTPDDFGTVTATACLAHDIGNPPLGHSGEDAIREWFENSSLGQKIINALSSEQEKNDLLHFQGNAQGFRILSHLEWPSGIGGLKLTCATLGAFSKYPRASYLPQQEQHKLYDGKYGFFKDNEEMFLGMATELGLVSASKDGNAWKRHPLTFLVEAADDICYNTVDVEDGFRLGQLSYKETKDLYESILCNSRADNKIKRMNNEKEKIEYLRALAINELVNQTADVFKNNIEELTCGRFDGELTKIIACHDDFSEFKKKAKNKVYTARRVVEIEAAGFSVIGTLLDAFVDSIEKEFSFKSHGKPTPPKQRTLLQLLPNSFLEENRKPNDDLYKRVMRIVDYVSGMTDTFAVTTFKKISGMAL